MPPVADTIRGQGCGEREKGHFESSRAAGDGWSLEYSQDHDEGHVVRWGRVALRKLLGFDLIHVWRNRSSIFEADVVWTHTELENLGVLGLFRLLGRRRRPKLVANCVWLFDRWSRLSWAKRFLYRKRITVVFESVVSGVPSICSDTGGLRAYFSESEVAYVPHSAPVAMRAAADQLAADDDWRFNMVASAQRRLLSAELTAHGFAMRNRRLSEELLTSS
jgi:hypothetical protein